MIPTPLFGETIAFLIFYKHIWNVHIKMCSVLTQMGFIVQFLSTKCVADTGPAAIVTKDCGLSLNLSLSEVRALTLGNVSCHIVSCPMESPPRESPPTKSLWDTEYCQHLPTWVISGEDSSSVEPWYDTSPASTLTAVLGEPLSQSTQLSHIRIPDTQKRGDNKCVLF